MAFADNLYVFWEPRLVLTQSSFAFTAQLLLNSVHTLGNVAGLDFVFHMFFLIKYSKSLEEGSFRGRSADFLWMLLIGQSLLGFCTLCKHTRKTRNSTSLSNICNYFRLSLGCVGGAVLTCCAPFVNIQFLGSSLTFMMVRASAFCPMLWPSRQQVA